MATARPHNRRPVISASEVGDFVYCAKAWHLKRTGAEAEGPALAAGTAFHTKHGAGVSQAARLQRWARLLLLLAIVWLIGMILFWVIAGGSK